MEWIRWDGMILTVSQLGMRRSAGGDTCLSLAILGCSHFRLTAASFLPQRTPVFAADG